MRKCIDDLILFSRLYPIRSPQMQTAFKQVQDPFLKEGLGLLMEGVYDEKSLHRILRYRMETYHRENLKIVEQLKMLSQGILFCSFLFIFWFAAKNELALAGWTLLFSTFFTSGIVNAISFSFKRSAFKRRAVNEAIVHGIFLISSKTNPIIVSEELNSFLPQDQRIPWVAAALPASQKAS